MDEGATNNVQEAEEMVNAMEFYMEIYYEKGYGLFAVDQDEVERGIIYSPYSGDECVENDGE